MDKRTFRVDPNRSTQFNLFKLELLLELIYRRLSNVTIEYLD
ncbi:hypothetical protein NPX99_07205 [Bartonella sp. 220]|nr:hypothetical protein [Bartonella sp. 220B]